MDALELTMKCSKLLKKPYSTSSNLDESVNSFVPSSFQSSMSNNTINNETTFLNASFSENDLELNRIVGKESSTLFGMSKFFACQIIFLINQHSSRG